MLHLLTCEARGKGALGVRGRVLFDERARAAPARVSEEVYEEAAVRRRALVVRPVDEHRAAYDQLARDEAPVAAVLAVVAVVAHGEVVPLRHVELLAAHGARRDPQTLRLPVDVVLALARRLGRVRVRQRHVLIVLERRAALVAVRRVAVLVARRVVGRDFVLGERLAVDENVRAANFDEVAGKTYDALHVVRLEGRRVAYADFGEELLGRVLARILEDDYVAAPYLALRQERE